MADPHQWARQWQSAKVAAQIQRDMQEAMKPLRLNLGAQWEAGRISAQMQDDLKRAMAPIAAQVKVSDVAAQMQRSLARTMAPVRLAELLEASSGAERVGESLARTMAVQSEGLFPRRLQLDLQRVLGPSFGDDFGSRLAQQLRHVTATADVHAQWGEQLRRALDVTPGMTDRLRAAIDELATSAEIVADEVEPPPDAGTAQWLARLPLWAQAFLMIYVLDALDEATRTIEQFSGADLPDSLQSLTRSLIAVAVVLATYLQLRADPPSD